MPEVRSGGARRLSLTGFLYLVTQFGPVAVLSNPVMRWAEGWWVNRSSILMFTATNTAITATSEILSRTLFAPLSKDPEAQHFLVHNTDGSLRVNLQSQISIIMTIFASLVGGPVYFFKRRWHRFLFFTGFGTSNSILAQNITGLATLGVGVLSPQRTLFDFFYNGTLKFLMFELSRPSILRFRTKVFRVGSIRIAQDFLTTLFKVVLLGALGLKG